MSAIAAIAIFRLASFLRDSAVHGVSRASVLAAAVALCAAVWVHAGELALDIADVEAAGFSARGLHASLSGPKLRELELRIDRLSVAGREWRKVRLTCAELQTAPSIACASGVLHLPEKIPLSFSYSNRTRDLAIELAPTAEEKLRIAGRLEGRNTALDVRMDKARLERLAGLFPAALPKLRGGVVSGTARLGSDSLTARLEVDGVAFADASGLHAGEKIGATLAADATLKGDEWRWSASASWRGGDVFWQPLFLTGKGQRLAAEGSTRGGMTQVRSARLDLPGIGTIDATGTWNHAKAALTAFEARSERVRAAALYADVLKPLLEGTALADMRAEGDISFRAQGAADALTALELAFDDVSFEDRQRRFAVFGLNGRIPWRHDDTSKGELSLNGGELLKIPVGPTRVPMRLKGLRVDVDSVRVPVLDGAITVREFAIGIARSGWRWRFSGEIAPISMEQLTTALGVPVMHGTLAGVIPEVRYRRRDVEMEGELMMRVFDGTMRASQVRLLDAFGAAPRMHADLDAKNIDLELLTRKFDFGTITGRIDAQVTGLELVAWQPVRFSARIASSAGTYPRRISQRAVQNISALGGAGAAVAIQRSLLRFFDTFGYARLGISCRLESNVCYMDGIERAPQGYVIVKGGGVPAISVIGYNRSVNWRELLDRLRRVTQGNIKPIVE